jgi:hypothetical protein
VKRERERETEWVWWQIYYSPGKICQEILTKGDSVVDERLLVDDMSCIVFYCTLSYIDIDMNRRRWSMLDYIIIWLCYCMFTYSSKLVVCLKHLCDVFFFWLVKRYLWIALTLSHEKKNQEKYYCCYCGYLLVIITSLETQSVRSIDLARASHTYAFRCHFGVCKDWIRCAHPSVTLYSVTSAHRPLKR